MQDSDAPKPLCDTSSTQTPNVVLGVLGDHTVDWLIAQGSGLASQSAVDISGDSCRTSLRCGGAALLYRMVSRILTDYDPEERALIQDRINHLKGSISSLPKQRVVEKRRLEATLSEYENQLNELKPADTATLCPIPSCVTALLQGHDSTEKSHLRSRRICMTVWARYPPASAWRIKESLGVARKIDTPALSFSHPTMRYESQLKSLEELSQRSEPRILLLNDESSGLRQTPSSWTANWKDGSAGSWIVLKLNSPLEPSEFFQNITEHCAERLVIITPVHELRRTLTISREISWEKTVADLLEQAVAGADAPFKSKCYALVVTFGADAAVLLRKDKRGAYATLFFSPTTMEGDYDQKTPGQMIGFGSCMAAAISSTLAHAVHTGADDLDLQELLRQGVEAGLYASRLLYEEGFNAAEQSDPLLDALYGRTTLPSLDFPVDAVAECISSHLWGDGIKSWRSELSDAPITRFTLNQQTVNSTWSILSTQPTNTGGLALRSVRLARLGFKKALTDCPVGVFGRFATADRTEIESLRSVKRLMSDYVVNRSLIAPLNIAVFGKPGTGKSFCLKELASTLEGGLAKSSITFNLSQFLDPSALFEAMHEIRDRALSGTIPLVFWDEFDCSLGNVPFGWLRYFLAPMQDGKFQQGQISHWIGRSFFIFAGSKFENGRAMLEATGGSFIDNKGTDFKSRLKGMIDILGPNESGLKPTEPVHLVRRAMLLRQIIEAKFKDLIDDCGLLRIEKGVLNAILNTSEFRHNTRSLEAILDMSSIHDKREFTSSDLPPVELLDLHVHQEDFMQRVRGTTTEFDLYYDECEELSRKDGQKLRNT